MTQLRRGMRRLKTKHNLKRKQKSLTIFGINIEKSSSNFTTQTTKEKQR